MVQVILGVKGSGNTKELVAAINHALEKDNGSLVCIERGKDLTYDINYRVRLLDALDYGISSYEFLEGFIAGLHGGNYDISHIFIDGLYKVAGSKDASGAEDFLAWCEDFGERNSVRFTFTVSDDPATAPYGVRKYAI